MLVDGKDDNHSVCTACPEHSLCPEQPSTQPASYPLKASHQLSQCAAALACIAGAQCDCGRHRPEPLWTADQRSGAQALCCEPHTHWQAGDQLCGIPRVISDTTWDETASRLVLLPAAPSAGCVGQLLLCCSCRRCGLRALMRWSLKQTGHSIKGAVTRPQLRHSW